MNKKDPDSDETRRRRRRKGGGLRVPSDNVPRRPTPHDTVGEPAEPAAADDPRLAVSLASAFGAQVPEASAPSRAFDELASERPATSGDSVDIELEEGDGRPGTNGAGGLAAPALPELPEPNGDDDRDTFVLDEPAEGNAGGRPALVRAFDHATHPPASAKVEAPATAAKTKVAPGTDVASGTDASSGKRASADREEAGTSSGRERSSGREVASDREASSGRETASARDVASASGNEAAAGNDAAVGNDAAAGNDAVAKSPRGYALSRAAPGDSSSRASELRAAATGAGEGSEAHVVEDADAGEPLASAVGARIEPSDASDSGELLTDDLLEEFEEPPTQPSMLIRKEVRQRQARAVAAPETAGATDAPAATDYGRDPRAATVIEPVEEIPAHDILEVEDSEERAAASEEPDYAPGARRAPPPAPKPAPPPPPAPAAQAAGPAAAPRPGKRRGKPWFEEIFDEDYLRTLPFLTPQATQRQARFVLESLGVEPGSQVLDVGCGYGRHAMELAARGHHVVGLDLSLPLLIRGADEAQRRGLTINFVHGDMREIQFESQFDGAYCLFSTFGYFDDETNKKVSKGIARALKPGAKLVLEVLNRDYLIADLPSRVWWEGDGCVVLEEVEFNYFSSRIVSNRSVVFDDGRQLEQEISMRAYALHELGKLLHAAGFRITEVSGSMDTRGRFFGAHSRELVIIAERRAQKDGRDRDDSGPRILPGSGSGTIA